MEALSSILARGNENGVCTQDTCAVVWSIYGYRPSLAATLLFLILFAISGVVYLYQAIKSKTWFFSIAMVIGCLVEVLGYCAKIILHIDPFSDVGFKMSIVLLTFAPAFYAAGLYYTLKHICLTFGKDYSRIRPVLYTYIFVSCDVISMSLQAVGGALASISTDTALLNAGTNVMITGLATQVFTMLVFGACAADYGLRAYRNRGHLNPSTYVLRNSIKFKMFLVALWLAYFGILIRCAYRVAELEAGWGGQNHIMRTEKLFIGLDSAPVCMAAIVLNIWHPGWCFPTNQTQTEEEKSRTEINIVEAGKM